MTKKRLRPFNNNLTTKKKVRLDEGLNDMYRHQTGEVAGLGGMVGLRRRSGSRGRKSRRISSRRRRSLSRGSRLESSSQTMDGDEVNGLVTNTENTFTDEDNGAEPGEVVARRMSRQRKLRKVSNNFERNSTDNTINPPDEGIFIYFFYFDCNSKIGDTWDKVL